MQQQKRRAADQFHDAVAGAFRRSSTFQGLFFELGDRSDVLLSGAPGSWVDQLAHRRQRSRAACGRSLNGNVNSRIKVTILAHGSWIHVETSPSALPFA